MPSSTATLALSISLAGLTACAHEQAAAHVPGNPSLNSVLRAPQDAAVVLQAVLGLIQNSRQLSDLTVEHVGRHLGQPLQQADGSSTLYGFNIGLDGNWQCGALLDSRQQPRLELSFNHDNDAASLQTLCQLDYAGFTARLEAQGLQRASFHGGHGQLQREIFSKPGLQVSVYPQGESAGNAQQLCVRMVSIP